MNDFVIVDQGTIVSFKPISQQAKDWVEANVSLEPWQWLGPAFGVDHRYAADLYQAIVDSGFEVSVQ